VGRPAWRAILAAAIGFGITLPGAVLAQEPASPSLSLEELGIKGKLLFKSFSHFKDVANDGNFRNEGILQLEWRRKLAPWSTLSLVTEARNDDGGFVHGFHMRIPDTEPTRSALSVKELVLGLHPAPVRIGVGKQIYTWGTGDGYNPTDNLNPYDYLDPLDREKMAVWSVDTTAAVTGWDLQFVVVPLFTPSRDPLPNGRWVAFGEEGLAAAVADQFGASVSPGVLQSLGLEGELPSALLRGRKVPDTGFETIQYAARVKTTRGGWDLSASYYEGFESTPVLKRFRSPAGVLVLQPVYTRLRAPGVDFSTAWKKFEFHGEAVAKFEERRGKDDRFQGLFGLNYTWDDLGLGWLEQVTFVLEHARETNLSSRSRSEFIESGAFTNAFRDALIGRAQAKFTEETQLTVAGTLDLGAEPNYYVQLKLSHKLRDTLHVEAGLDFLDGLKDTFWGKWRKNDRFFASLKYFF